MARCPSLQQTNRFQISGLKIGQTDYAVGIGSVEAYAAVGRDCVLVTGWVATLTFVFVPRPVRSCFTISFQLFNVDHINTNRLR